MHKHILTGMLAAVAVVSMVPSAQAQPGRNCFYVNQWNGWKAADDHTVYLRVSGNKIYEIDMARSCPELQIPGARLITNDRSGTGLMCSAVDWDLKVSDGHGVVVPCIVSGISEMTPDEVAAIPKKDMP